MQGEISRLYYKYNRFVSDTARKTEKTMKQELLRPELDAQGFRKFNYWDGGQKGLLSGEVLYLNFKRVELAYHDYNKRELELTPHVSLRQLAPLALLTRKATGDYTLTIPEGLYDRDCPTTISPYQERSALDPVRRRPIPQHQLYSLTVAQPFVQVPDRR